MGAAVGAIYASDVTPSMMEGLLVNIDTRLYYDVSVPKMGFMKGNKLESLIRLLTKRKTFDELSIPMCITAVDLVNNELVEFREGLVYKAVRASISIPGIFTPVEIDDMMLVDGGLLERVPGIQARNMGADVVIGVDVGFHGQHTKPQNIMETTMYSFDVVSLKLYDRSLTHCDIMLEPDVNDFNPAVFTNAEKIIEAGRIEARKKMPDILKLLGLELDVIGE